MEETTLDIIRDFIAFGLCLCLALSDSDSDSTTLSICILLLVRNPSHSP